MAKKRNVTVTIKLNRDDSTTFRSTGGFDLRKLFPEQFGIEPTPAIIDHNRQELDPAEKAGT